MLKEEEAFFAEMVYRESGIVLGNDKGYLVDSRLAPLAREQGFRSLREFYEANRDNITPQLKRDIVEALTTNETLFFRDVSPFRFLQKSLIPKYLASFNRPIRIWCAAASTGQEPYSIVMSFLENWPGLKNTDLDILATDINTRVIDRAKQGIYTQIEVNRGLPVQMLAKYFRQDGNQWILSPKVREFVRWNVVNLKQPNTVPGLFDLIFCRNVLIYFDIPTKKMILERLAAVLKPDGILFLGATESAVGITDVIQSQMIPEGGLYYILNKK